MSDEAMPEPRSSFELRKHLDHDHRLPLTGLAWVELVKVHDQDHRADPGHTHEVGGDG